MEELFKAISEGNLEKVGNVLGDDYTLLSKVAKTTISSGSDSLYGQITPLICASFFNNLEIVEYMLGLIQDHYTGAETEDATAEDMADFIINYDMDGTLEQEEGAQEAIFTALALTTNEEIQNALVNAGAEDEEYEIEYVGTPENTTNSEVPFEYDISDWGDNPPPFDDGFGSSV